MLHNRGDYPCGSLTMLSTCLLLLWTNLVDPPVITWSLVFFLAMRLLASGLPRAKHLIWFCLVKLNFLMSVLFLFLFLSPPLPFGLHAFSNFRWPWLLSVPCTFAIFFKKWLFSRLFWLCNPFTMLPNFLWSAFSKWTRALSCSSISVALLTSSNAPILPSLLSSTWARAGCTHSAALGTKIGLTRRECRISLEALKHLVLSDNDSL